MNDNVAVLLTALNLEYDAVRAHLTDVQTHRHEHGTRFEIGTVRGTSCRVVLGLAGIGNQASAVLVERAVAEFTPIAVVFSGVAGALWDTPLGDVVVATRVYGYHGATSEDDGRKARPRAWDLAHGVEQVATHLARSGTWLAGLPGLSGSPSVHFRPIAAGEVVQNSRVSGDAAWIRQHYNDACAVEMEGAGVAQAGHLSSTPVVVVRGLSDRADGTKGTGNDLNWQPVAAANAASFAVRLAAELIVEQEHEMRSSSDKPQPGAVTNIAHGTVGIQAGHVEHSVVVQNAGAETASTDLAAQLAAIRAELTAGHASGALDTDTFQAAQGELDVADEALAAETPARKRKAVVALKKLTGLVAGVTDIAAKVTALLVALNGLS
ncbi:nucleoside phosphorylase [Prauserella sediminis]|uniref:Nucleoside phosphorylase n=1 Tax=Prauserella sediminis TaxID=577680 RepID=A0A839XU94_9PSEU|nr:5'-methylthioadenosine/S-adenosylhomocysteine nucleosidase [Prauserella sediminis]MBB3666307.1 nucleoside phosphorylase [Prauserella sediminis]